MKFFSHVFAMLGLLGSAAGLALDFYAIVPVVMTASETNPVPRGFFDALIYFWFFLTHLANLGAVLVYVAEIWDPWWLRWFRRPYVHLVVLAMLMLVMGFFHVMLAPLYTFEGALAVANLLLHYVAPLLYLGWWAAFSPHGTVRLGHVPLMLLPGLAYLALVLVRGAIVGEYPYAIVDAGQFGYLQVAIGAGSVTVGVAAISAFLVGLDKALMPRPRKNPPADRLGKKSGA